MFSLLAAFVLGTFDRVDLRRNYFGKVVLSKTWRICFIPCITTKVPRGSFESVSTSANTDRAAFDYVMLAWLSSLCLVPGVLWWIFAFSKPVYQVALTKDHGHPALILYQGINEDHMNEIAKTVSAVCRCRWRRTY